MTCQRKEWIRTKHPHDWQESWDLHIRITLKGAQGQCLPTQLHLCRMKDRTRRQRKSDYMDGGYRLVLGEQGLTPWASHRRLTSDPKWCLSPSDPTGELFSKTLLHCCNIRLVQCASLRCIKAIWLAEQILANTQVIAGN